MTAATEDVFYICSMCSYGARSEETLTSHVCKSHRNDPRFHIYCKSCLRSYKKWDSYRKHIERSCKIIPSITVSIDNPDIAEEVDTMGNVEEEASEIVQNLDGTFLIIKSKVDNGMMRLMLSIKEKHVLPQVAVDRVLLSTRDLVSEILSGLMNEIRGCVPVNGMNLLEEKVEHIKDTLFESVSTAFLQKKIFQGAF